MAIVLTTDVFCDGDYCPQWVNGATGQRSRKYDALKVAKREGWRITSRRHLCPRCARTEHQPHKESRDEETVF